MKTLKTKLLSTVLCLLAIGCSKEEPHQPCLTDGRCGTTNHEIHLFKVDFTTYEFQGGTRLFLSKDINDFNVESLYIPPSDFGSMTLKCKETGDSLFAGTIHWMGKGQQTFPRFMDAASMYDYVLTSDYVFPKKIIGVDSANLNLGDVERAWSNIQGLTKVRSFLNANPHQDVFAYCYTPSVGIGNPEDWYWIFLIRNW
jgi:hypothetical protein